MADSVNKNPVGRPSVMTPNNLERLRAAFMIGATDEEACAAADIACSTLYYYQNTHPEFLEEKTKLKEQPFLKARQTIYDSLDKPINAQWFMERKRKTEFAQRQELTGKEGKDLPVPLLQGITDVVSSNNSGTEAK